MTDVQLVHFRQRGNSLNVMVRQAVTGVNLQPQARGIGCRFGDTFQLFCLSGIRLRISIAAGVNFDKGAPTSAAALICA